MDAFGKESRTNRSIVSWNALSHRTTIFLSAVWSLSTRAVERLERDVTIGNEALALFVRFWLTTTPPLPDTMREAAQAKGRERYEDFVDTLRRRLAKGSILSKEVSEDVADLRSEQ
jgi:hypothetical protein